MTDGVLTVDFRGGDVLVWRCTDDGGVDRERITDYRPAISVTREGAPVADARAAIERRHDVVETRVEQKRRGWRTEPERVLRVTVRDVERVRPVASRVRDLGAPGEYRCYDVDVTRGFRYCLDADVEPVPQRSLRTLELAVPEPALNDAPLEAVTIDGQRHEGEPGDLVGRVADAVERTDPDVLVVNSGEAIPTLFEVATEAGVDLQLGRRPGWQRLAGASTYESYGTVQHSPARYTVPGRAVIDRSNTFFYRQAGLDGCLDLVARSRKPLQELSWASIGTVLTAIQIRTARERGVLVPWHSYRPEFFKSARTLDAADRGGHTFEPAVGVHDDVHELDFASLYPNIICTRNISPDTIRCDCHADRVDVPKLGYSICDDRGYLVDVLEPLVDDRADYKVLREEASDPEQAAKLDRKVEAIKWILVSCFGYQGFSNAKFGRIECHEAINAFAREILLDAKETLESGGWRVVHGIVDSLWVTGTSDVPPTQRTPLPGLADQITQNAGISLEYEAAYDWIAFVPQRTSSAGALTKYFGSVAGEDEYKYRGIECRQDSTPPFIADVQRDLIQVLDATRTPEAVCDRLQEHLRQLQGGNVNPIELAVDKRAGKATDSYTQYTQTVAALERAEDQGLERSPGQYVKYVVVDDEKSSRERVQLVREDPEIYDASFYSEKLIRAAESVLSPLGWRQNDIEQYLAERQDGSILNYTFSG
ncbi:MAG: type B DNA-directed DNA polymerase [Haloarculaceae archaeon]